MTQRTRHSGRACLTVGLLALAAAGAAVTDVRASDAARPAGQQQIAFEDVVANLKVGDPRVKLDALKMLGRAGYLEAAPAVVSLLTDSVAEVQIETINTLLSLYLIDEAYTRQFGATVVRQKGASLALLAFAQGPGQLVANPFPPELVKGLVTCLSSSVAEVRFDAAYAFGVFGPVAAQRGGVPDGKVAVDRLTGLAKDANPLLRLAGTQVLGRLYAAALRNEPANAEIVAAKLETGDQIIAGINDPDEFVKIASVKTVGEMRHERAIQALIDQFGYYKGTVAYESLVAIGRIAHPGSLGFLAAALQSKNEQFRAAAVVGIGRVGDRSAIFNMESLTARDKSPAVRLALAFSKAKNGDLSQIVTIAEGFAKDETASDAYEYLIELGPPIADALAPIASHREAKVRAGLAEVLGSIGNQQSLFVVQSLSRDRNAAAAAAGLRSVKRLSPRPSNAPRLM